MSDKSLGGLLQELMGAANVNLEKLFEVTRVPKRFLVALLEDNFSELPAKPYVRGYLLKIAPALNVNPEVLIKRYKELSTIPSSGERDLLPQNRFAIQPLSRSWGVVLLILAIPFIYLALRTDDILGIPQIEISSPKEEIVTGSVIKIVGRVSPEDRLTLNGEAVYTDEAGRFEKEVSLDPGLNTLEFTARRFLGRETKLFKQIYYQTP